LGSSASGFRAIGVDAGAGEQAVDVWVTFEQERGPLVATRHYRAWPGRSAIEVWTEFSTRGDARRRVHDLNAMSLTVATGRVHWVTGLDVEGQPFTRRSQALQPGESVSLGSPVVSSSHAVPAMTVVGAEGAVFAALAWSGAWSGTADGQDGAVHVRLGLPAMSTEVTPGAVVEGPHAWLGVTPGDEHDAAAALQQALVAGRPTPPSWSTFNTWFVHGTAITAANMRDAIDQVSRVGIELFQLDAGWYPQPGATSIWDFTTGLGSWQVDRSRFPDGLGPIGDHARAHGMRFGVWVEPERVDLSTVGQPGLAEERFLATAGGAYDLARPASETPDGQICLGHHEARAWVLARLIAFIEDARPDYLKWDFNRWLICDREDHDHGAEGGSFAHVRGLYDVLQALHARFPSLEIENCSGGGHRLDAGLARLTHAGWMDDRSAPSARVRHNLEGLSAVFPAGYLLSYVMPHEDEPMAGAADMAGLARSRMMGTLGLAVNLRTIGERDINGLTQEVHLARALRAYQSGALTYLLTEQAGARPAWEVVQQWSQVPGRGVLWVFAEPGTDARGRVRLRALDRSAVYEVREVTTNRRERLSGATLLDNGLELRAAPESLAQVFTIDLVGSAPQRLR
jgi:alpha-galactosidase